MPPLWWYGIASWGERGSKTQGCEEGGGGGRTLPSSVLGRGGKEGEGKRLGEREGRKEGRRASCLSRYTSVLYVRIVVGGEEGGVGGGGGGLP